MKSLSGVELFGSAHLKLFTFLARHSALHYNNWWKRACGLLICIGILDATISFNPLRTNIIEKNIILKNYFFQRTFVIFKSSFLNVLYLRLILLIYLLFFCLARSRKERFTFGTTSTLWVWLKKTPTLSYQSCFPVYIGYPRITGTSKYRFLAFHSLFPRLRGRGFCFYWVIYCILQGWVPSVTCNQDPWWEKNGK